MSSVVVHIGVAGVDGMYIHYNEDEDASTASCIDKITLHDTVSPRVEAKRIHQNFLSLNPTLAPFASLSQLVTIISKEVAIWRSARMSTNVPPTKKID